MNNQKSVIAATLALSIAGLAGCDGGTEPEPTFNPRQITMPATPADTETQIQMLQEQLATDPDNELLLTTLADIYFEARRFQEAIPVYKKAAMLNPVNADTFNDLGLSYHYTGQTDKALAALDQAIEGDPLFKHAYLSKGFILFSEGRHGEAAEPLKKLKELDKNGPLGREADRFLQQIQAVTGG